MRLLTACLLCALALPAVAQIYKYTDANGNTVFTNQPPQGTPSETIELQPTNTVAPPPAPPSTSNSSSATTDSNVVYNVVELTGISDEQALRANNGTFTVGVRIEPALRPGHSLRLLLDGRPYGQPSTSPPLQVSTADRGEHSLAVEVMRGEQIIQQSPTVTFTVQRVNTRSPALRPSPAKPTPKPKPAT